MSSSTSTSTTTKSPSLTLHVMPGQHVGPVPFGLPLFQLVEMFLTRHLNSSNIPAAAQQPPENNEENSENHNASDDSSSHYQQKEPSLLFKNAKISHPRFPGSADIEVELPSAGLILCFDAHSHRFASAWFSPKEANCIVEVLVGGLQICKAGRTSSPEIPTLRRIVDVLGPTSPGSFRLDDDKLYDVVYPGCVISFIIPTAEYKAELLNQTTSTSSDSKNQVVSMIRKQETTFKDGTTPIAQRIVWHSMEPGSQGARGLRHSGSSTSLLASSPTTSAPQQFSSANFGPQASISQVAVGGWAASTLAQTSSFLAAEVLPGIGVRFHCRPPPDENVNLFPTQASYGSGLDLFAMNNNNNNNSASNRLSVSQQQLSGKKQVLRTCEILLGQNPQDVISLFGQPQLVWPHISRSDNVIGHAVMLVVSRQADGTAASSASAGGGSGGGRSSSFFNNNSSEAVRPGFSFCYPALGFNVIFSSTNRVESILLSNSAPGHEYFLRYARCPFALFGTDSTCLGLLGISLENTSSNSNNETGTFSAALPPPAAQQQQGKKESVVAFSNNNSQSTPSSSNNNKTKAAGKGGKKDSSSNNNSNNNKGGKNNKNNKNNNSDTGHYSSFQRSDDDDDNNSPSPTDSHGTPPALTPVNRSPHNSSVAAQPIGTSVSNESLNLYQNQTVCKVFDMYSTWSDVAGHIAGTTREKLRKSIPSSADHHPSSSSSPSSSSAASEQQIIDRASSIPPGLSITSHEGPLRVVPLHGLCFTIASSGAIASVQIGRLPRRLARTTVGRGAMKVKLPVRSDVSSATAPTAAPRTLAGRKGSNSSNVNNNNNGGAFVVDDVAAEFDDCFNSSDDGSDVDADVDLVDENEVAEEETKLSERLQQQEGISTKNNNANHNNNKNKKEQSPTSSTAEGDSTSSFAPPLQQNSTRVLGDEDGDEQQKSPTASSTNGESSQPTSPMPSMRESTQAPDSFEDVEVNNNTNNQNKDPNSKSRLSNNSAATAAGTSAILSSSSLSQKSNKSNNNNNNAQGELPSVASTTSQAHTNDPITDGNNQPSERHFGFEDDNIDEDEENNEKHVDPTANVDDDDADYDAVDENDNNNNQENDEEKYYDEENYETYDAEGAYYAEEGAEVPAVDEEKEDQGDNDNTTPTDEQPQSKSEKTFAEMIAEGNNANNNNHNNDDDNDDIGAEVKRSSSSQEEEAEKIIVSDSPTNPSTNSSSSNSNNNGGKKKGKKGGKKGR